ncbi:DUF2786 domain-containing protein [Hamadaea sp. NPDC050747]|uniref:DUF2786 domain-containing protein n=1 Tax=Hamadaea sp. NPDC050747 TaxID=3155789 RepID=UPI0033CF05A0
MGDKRVPSEREIVERIVAEGVFAYDARRPAEVSRAAQALAARPGAPTAVFALMQAEVLAVWQRGWQPFELHRSVRKALTEEHARLAGAAMIAQTRTYAATTVDERWQAQLTQIAPAKSRDNAARSRDGAASDRDNAAGAARTDPQQVIQTIWHLRRLPNLPFQGPLPGQARPRHIHQHTVDQKMLDRVRALLAKAESTTFPEEAEAYTAKAQELMARHSIDFALLMARTGGKDEPAVRRIPIDNPYEAAKTLLLQAVAEANGCRSVWTESYGFATVTGFPGDLDSVELLFTSLLVQAVTAMTQSGPRQDRFGRNNTRSFRQAFLTAYAQRIGERLRGATEAAVSETIRDVGESTLLPVLKARTEEVESRFQELFPTLRTRSITVSNRQGWAEGRAAADRAELHSRRAVRE